VPVEKPDYVISESTYGDRAHPAGEEVAAQLAGLVNTVSERGSRLIIPAFSVGRLQTVIYHLNQLHEAGRIGQAPIYVDSPLALKATDIFRRHTECYDAEANAFLLNGRRPFSFSTLKYVTTVEESKKLNDRQGPVVIVSSSGMCEGGRVLHHLVHSVGDERNIILLTGFQAEETLGRKLLEGVNPVNILGASYSVLAKVVMMGALSAHADAREICDYFRACRAEPRGAFLVHGEPAPAEALRGVLAEQLGWKNIAVPQLRDSVELAIGA